MMESVFFPANGTPVLSFAAAELEARGYTVARTMGAGVTHVLLNVPSFADDGSLRGGGTLEGLPETAVIYGGNLGGRPGVDLLKDPLYLAENAALTADCAIRLAGSRLNRVWRDCPVLVLGWGRIGKLLSRQLPAIGANLTVAARSRQDRAMVRAMGLSAMPPEDCGAALGRYRVVFNTIPAPVLTTENARPDAVLLDLASVRGMEGDAATEARGLPGRLAPESAGKLLARTVLRLSAGEEVRL